VLHSTHKNKQNDNDRPSLPVKSLFPQGVKQHATVGTASALSRRLPLGFVLLLVRSVQPLKAPADLIFE
jgi:hypothetical protein